MNAINMTETDKQSAISYLNAITKRRPLNIFVNPQISMDSIYAIAILQLSFEGNHKIYLTNSTTFLNNHPTIANDITINLGAEHKRRYYKSSAEVLAMLGREPIDTKAIDEIIKDVSFDYTSDYKLHKKVLAMVEKVRPSIALAMKN